AGCFGPQWVNTRADAGGRGGGIRSRRPEIVKNRSRDGPGCVFGQPVVFVELEKAELRANERAAEFCCPAPQRLVSVAPQVGGRHVNEAFTRRPTVGEPQCPVPVKATSETTAIRHEPTVL